MSGRLAVRPLVQAIRQSHSTPHKGLQLAKFQGQTPTGFIHDGWAMSVSFVYPYLLAYFRYGSHNYIYNLVDIYYIFFLSATSIQCS